MFTLKTSAEPTKLDEEIIRLLTIMEEETPDSDEYSKTADQLIKLMKLREEISSKRRVSPDTLAVVLGNIAGIGLILSYERAHVITSKALGFVMKSMR